MAKNLKFKVKNAQLAEALNLKKKQPSKKEEEEKKAPPKKEEAPAAETKQIPQDQPIVEETTQEAEKKPLKKATDTPSFLQERQKKQYDKDSLDSFEGDGLSKRLAGTISPKKDEIGYIRPGTDKVALEKRRLEEEARQQEEKKQQEQKKEASLQEKKEKAPKERPEKTNKETEQTPASTQQDKDRNKKSAKIKEFKESKALKKFQQSRVFDARDRQGLRAGDDDHWRRKRQGKQRLKDQQLEETIRPKSLHIKLPISIKDLAAAMKYKAAELIQKFFMQGAVFTINDMLDDETTVQLLGQEFGCDITIDTSEKERLNITDKSITEEILESPQDELETRPPVITMMGHVDHGKTSLIDAFRKSNLAAGEAGAITQHIGAFRCKTPDGRMITLLDTPGHEAFTAMRTRGANLTDIIVLVVAGDEGIKPQTAEAIKLAKDANVPIIVAINKSDKPGFNPDQVYRQLADHNMLPEAWGGTVSTVNCSAHTKEGLNELLELVLLQAELLELKANPHFRARGIVIEAEVLKGLGTSATLLIQNGSLHLGDALVIEHVYGRIKTMHDDKAQHIQVATPGMPVQVTGLSDLPDAGSEFIIVKNEKEARQLAKERTAISKRQVLSIGSSSGLENLLQSEVTKQQKKILNIILKTDVHGSIEAIVNALKEKIKSDKAEVNVIAAEIGDISESDVQRAATANAVIFGFHVSVEMHAESLVKQLQVKIELFDVIYHLIDRVKELLTLLLDKTREETHVGMARVLQIFKSSHLGIIAGCIVADGIIKRSHYAKLIRNGEQIWEGNIASIKRLHDDVKEVSKGLECGIILQNFKELKPEDEVHAYEVTYVAQSL
ncbi:MAG: translation initiation factor IF-2 [Simkaniaceae bacterium]|nr:translation initiation factor IF-2 [Simkaniaceae bacterium]